MRNGLNLPESGRAKVDELDAEVLVDDDVLVLEVAVEDAVLVEVVDGRDDLQRVQGTEENYA